MALLSERCPECSAPIEKRETSSTTRSWRVTVSYRCGAAWEQTNSVEKPAKKLECLRGGTRGAD